MILLIAFVIVFIAVCVWLLISLSRHNNKGFIEVILFLGLFGIICAITAFYMANGFDLYLNLFCLFPFYAFILWVFWKIYPMIKRILKDY